MAVPQRKVSKSRKRMRRAHHHVPVPNVIYCHCGEPSLPHCVCPGCGTYRGRQYLQAEDV